MKRIFSIIAGLVFLTLLFASLPALGLAQGKSVVVERRDGDVTILPNGDMNFVETWQVRFEGGPFHYAFRGIARSRNDGITNWAVSENGIQYRESGSENAGTFETYDDTEKNEQVVKWFFNSATDTTKTFEIRYTVHDGVRIYPGGDQFYWKFIESDRQYPILASTVTLHLPGNFPTNQIKATTYRDGAEQAGTARVVDGSTVVFDGKNFTEGTEWELRAQFPHGAISAGPAAWQTAEDQRAQTEPIYNFGSLFGSLLILIAGISGLYLLWYTRGRDRPAGVVAEFYTEPPEDIPPGVAGTLIDEHADLPDIVATIVDLARRGIIKMKEQKSEGFLGIGSNSDFTYELVGSTDGLRPFEQTLVTKMFGRSTSRDLSDLKNKFYTAIPEIKSQLYQEVVRDGYFNQDPNTTRTQFAVLGVVGLVLFGACACIAYGALADLAPAAICVPIALGLVGIGFLVLAPHMPKRTDKGSTATAKWKAFKNYLGNIEKYTKVEDAKDLFDKYLPFAIAFGLEHSWVDKFARVDTPAPSWYYPYYGGGYSRGYSGGTLSAGGSSGGGGGGSGRVPSLNEASASGFRGLNGMSTGLFSMLSSTASTFTSAPSSSGGGGGWSGGGGGFGGGGGGGGGGGSSGFG